jgi:intracellular sulfur oxidation DsrE/DsrF family protein
MSRSRREFITTLAASSAVLAVSESASATPAPLDPGTLRKSTDLACVYHCDFGEPQRFSTMLQNMLNHYAAYDNDSFRLTLVVVAHGPGLKFFLEDLAGTPWEKESLDPELYKRFSGLAKYGAEAYLCDITFARLKIDHAKARKDSFLRLVPSGIAAIGELEAKGFGYLKVG